MNIFNFFKNSVNQYPNSDALVVNKVAYTYHELEKIAQQISFYLKDFNNSPTIGIYASRTLTAYAGLLSSLSQGNPYVAINKKNPTRRNKEIIDSSGAEILIVDKNSINQLQEIGKKLNHVTTLILPEVTEDEIPYALKNNFKIIAKNHLNKTFTEVKEVGKNHLAYIIFTSGSTGKPKGVRLSHGNFNTYLKNYMQFFQLNNKDRVSQFYELTFDAAMLEIFVCWYSGSALYVLPENALIMPAKFIQENQLNLWSGVASNIYFLNKFRLLKDNAFSSLKYTIFGGEKLTMEMAEKWKKAAPNSVIANSYGPAETTIGVTYYALPDDISQTKNIEGNISVGKVFDNLKYCLLDENGNLSTSLGELCISGAQVSEGYHNDIDKTRESFVSINNDNEIWYKTGDIMIEKDGFLFYKNRKDFQVKIRGNRVELEEVNRYIKHLTNADFVFSIPYPIKDGITQSFYTFIDKEIEMDKDKFYALLKNKFPEYMIPKNIIFVENIPLNSNQKVEQRRLLDLI